MIPAESSEDNCLVPDLGVTCAPPTDEPLTHEPPVLIEILSPTDVSKTRANIRASRTIATVAEIVVLHATAVVCGGPQTHTRGGWPPQPDIIGPDSELRLDSLGFAAPLRDAYRTSGLA